MSRIHVLDQATINQIAAGEAVERPASVAKELIENAIDAGSRRIAVEIKDGGISLLRVTDNGRGIAPEDVPLAFLPHATSKITQAEDLQGLSSLGFRGEALSSICAVSRVELITKRAEDLTATRCRVEGGHEVLREEIGAPDGTTVVMRDLFFNTPARAKFLRTAATEAAHVGAFVEQLILSNPDIAFTYIVNGQKKLVSSGSGRLADAIFHIYGREVSDMLLPVDAEEESLTIRGMIGKPQINRGNRNFENYYVNGRYVKSRILSRAIEDGYGTRLMQHQYPFTCLMLELKGGEVDVNVHPTKMEVRFSDEKQVYERVRRVIHETLSGPEMVLVLKEDSKAAGDEGREASKVTKEPRPAEPFETGRAAAETPQSLKPEAPQFRGPEAQQPMRPEAQQARRAEERLRTLLLQEEDSPYAGRELIHDEVREHRAAPLQVKKDAAKAGSIGGAAAAEAEANRPGNAIPAEAEGRSMEIAAAVREEEPSGMALPAGEKESPRGRFVQQSFAPAFLSEEAKPNRRIVGQVFMTYWICEYGDKVFVFDQHAAHERVLFERFMKAYENRQISSEMLMPPMIVTLGAREEELLLSNREAFEQLGFEIEHFGERDYAIRAVPYNLGTIRSETLFREFLDQLEVTPDLQDMKLYIRKIATEACKAAVKGGGRLSEKEAQQLLDDLMQCEDPYHCPHGRPTILSFGQKDIEKRFRRIV